MKAQAAPESHVVVEVGEVPGVLAKSLECMKRRVPGILENLV